MTSTSRKIILAFVISAILVTMLACGVTSTPQVATQTPVMPPSEAVTSTFTSVPLLNIVSLVSNTTKETVKSPDYTINAQTPSFQGSEDLRVLNFNNEMKQLTQEEIAKFKENVVQVTPLPGTSGSSYEQQYKLVSPPGNLFSLKFQITIYVQGAAHPGTHFRTVTYDLESGMDVKLAHFFLPGSDYLERIANYCTEQLKKRDIGFDSSSSGARPLPENYGNWNITPEGLLITFNEYQVAAYALGPQEVVIPYAELKSVIDPQGQLAGFLVK